MPIDFRIFADRGLVLIQASGFVTIDETVAGMARYEAQTTFDANHKQLVDLTRVTGFERDYARFLEIQADKAGRFTAAGAQMLIVYLAPTAEAQAIASLFARSWECTDTIVATIQHEEARALSVLGQPETSLRDLLQTAM
ncbi:MAG: hypothetical protein AAFY38_02285 [Pseudomonadota bacterium]